METPHDANSSQMRAVYGNRLRLDNPLLGDNPKVLALRKDQSDSNLKVLIDEALKKFFFSGTDTDEDGGAEKNLDSETEVKVPEIVSPDKISVLMSIFKMLMETVFSNKTKG